MKRPLTLFFALAATTVPAYLAARSLARSIDSGIRTAVGVDPEDMR